MIAYFYKAFTRSVTEYCFRLYLRSNSAISTYKLLWQFRYHLILIFYSISCNIFPIYSLSPVLSLLINFNIFFRANFWEDTSVAEYDQWGGYSMATAGMGVGRGMLSRQGSQPTDYAYYHGQAYPPSASYSQYGMSYVGQFYWLTIVFDVWR